MNPTLHPAQLPTVHVLAGPQAGRSWVLPVGRSMIGRARGCAVQLGDPAVEAHHAVIEVGRCGIDVLQLAGRQPLIVDGVALAGTDGAAPVCRSIEIGHSVIGVEPSARPPAGRVVLGIDDSGSPVFAHLTWRPVELIGVVANPAVPELRAVARTVAESLRAQATEIAGRPLVVTERAADVVSACERGDDVTVVAVLSADSPAIGRCTARVDVGPRWRGRWTADVRRPLRIVRVHLRGDGGQPTPAGRSSLTR